MPMLRIPVHVNRISVHVRFSPMDVCLIPMPMRLTSVHVLLSRTTTSIVGV